MLVSHSEVLMIPSLVLRAQAFPSASVSGSGGDCNIALSCMTSITSLTKVPWWIDAASNSPTANSLACTLACCLSVVHGCWHRTLLRQRTVCRSWNFASLTNSISINTLYCCLWGCWLTCELIVSCCFNPPSQTQQLDPLLTLKLRAAKLQLHLQSLAAAVGVPLKRFHH